MSKFIKREESRKEVIPRQMPLEESNLPPKLHSSPFVWSHCFVLLQSSKSCWAQTLQHPQLSRMRLTPAAHLGTSGGHRQSFRQDVDTWDKTNISNQTFAFTSDHRLTTSQRQCMNEQFPHWYNKEDHKDKYFPHLQRLKLRFCIIHQTWQWVDECLLSFFWSCHLPLYTLSRSDVTICWRGVLKLWEECSSLCPPISP